MLHHRPTRFRTLPTPLRPRALVFSLLAFVTTLTARAEEIPPPPSGATATVLRTPRLPPDMPEDAVLARLVNDASLQSGPAAREIAAALRAVRYSPQSSDAFLRLAAALSERARATLSTALYAPVEHLYLQAYKLDSTNAAALTGLAWAAGAAHRFDDSIAWATLALSRDADQPDAHALLGDAALELGRYENAREHYEKLEALRPGLPAYARLAQLLYQQGDAPGALTLMRRALDTSSGSPAASAWCAAALATLQVREGAAPLALALLKPWVEKHPQDVTLLNALGATYIALDEDALALATYEHSAELQPQQATLAALHALYLAAERPHDAAAIYERVAALAKAHLAQGMQGGEGGLARFYADAGINSAEAVLLARAEATHHHTPTATATLAWALHRAGDTRAASALVPELLRQRVPEAAFLYYAATITEASADKASARDLYAAALARQPRWHPQQTPLAHAALARLASATPVGSNPRP